MVHPSFSSVMKQQKEQFETSSLMELLEKMIIIAEEHKNTETKPLVLTVKDAATELQISIPSLRDHFLCRPDFPKIRVGTKILIPRKAFEDWINQQF
ncbi:helix-turn-helix domain-containing protein [Hazenella sp. IB182357]|uniref:Helix-turn-helix domain-containing protein n=1 Tax=Polycladospora coralii TaxID=2771432 RepID=A0A926RTZ5_9BACL|nr:helix-turn-helix domain-containing protein [Polycladospora coralii]MBD1371957.1 helix-turn-helix domain-containing protein [Polycladospora coralii]